jgi:uncharacterized protein (TIGR00725 family)
MRQLIGVLAGRAANTTPEACALAEAVGAEIARRGASVVCGGGDGAMEAVCRGCKRAGGTTIGLLKFSDHDDANPHIDFAIPTSMDLARNNIIVWSAMGVIAFDGWYGTSSEIFLALDIGKPLVVVGDRCPIRPDAFASPGCVKLPNVSPDRAVHVVDTLFDLIERFPPRKHPRSGAG